jgi:aerobic-type carbon monoxide dehydrogenase small subunit (CoxS/CutS family)
VPDDRAQLEAPVNTDLRLRVNGIEHELTIDTRTSLLDLLQRAPRSDRVQEGL